MRSPVIAFSLLAAAAVSPVLVAGAPTSPKLENALENMNRHPIREVPPTPAAPSLPGPLGGLVGGAPTGQDKVAQENQNDPVHRTAAMKKAKEQAQPAAPKLNAAAPKGKRASDMNTAGGNAYSGAALDSSGGDVENDATQGGLTNDDTSNQAGGAGNSFSGFAFGGNGGSHGPGGNAYSGATGASRGGNVVNTSEGGAGAGGSDIENTTANNAGGGGFSESGTAMGGNARGPAIPAGLDRRASDSGTAGGNAYSGATSDVSGGSVANAADEDGTITNDGSNTAGGAGTTFSGDADGGNGNGFGPGGNAYSGASGPAVGGGVYNYGGTIDNTPDSNVAGGGGTSESGDANGGRA